MPEYLYDPVSGYYIADQEDYRDEAVIAALLLLLARAGRPVEELAASGRILSLPRLMAAVDFYIDGAMLGMADGWWSGLRSGTLTVREVQLQGERALARLHLSAAIAAKGGVAQMAAADYSKVAAIVERELGYWRDLNMEIAAGRPLDGGVKASMRGFVSAAANTFHEVQQTEMAIRGFDLYANVLRDFARHCTGKLGRPSCVQVTAAGFKPLGEHPERGRRGCHWNCKCWWIYKNSRTGETRY